MDEVSFWGCVETERAKEVRKKRAKMRVKDLMRVGGARRPGIVKK